jgi:hypothetical protein
MCTFLTKFYFLLISFATIDFLNCFLCVLKAIFCLKKNDPYLFLNEKYNSLQIVKCINFFDKMDEAL